MDYYINIERGEMCEYNCRENEKRRLSNENKR